MHFLTSFTATLLLASSRTLALILPENYTIIEVVPIEPEYMYEEAQGNPHVPLIHATLTCGREYTPFYEIYTLVGAHWDGVSEEQLRWAAKQGGWMTRWHYFSFKENECFWRDGEMECPIRPAGWEASVSSFFFCAKKSTLDLHSEQLLSSSRIRIIVARLLILLCCYLCSSSSR